ncbi:MAG: hypothetical protein HXX08_23130 [Chloroflexi bacterium]|uniref:Uncharacterized protein n=1 Tax=Candidatus Chlorohelix allophototropha TaxID=3003348 RepID=A0A8T7M9V1_9CHLR|nr:hypothetical protein [Chloroflexota bacterium]WJW68698.1 hypothetical protein OZ401_004314 [Chloroflexota bacterium L227-S17]
MAGEGGSDWYTPFGDTLSGYRQYGRGSTRPVLTHEGRIQIPSTGTEMAQLFGDVPHIPLKSLLHTTRSGKLFTLLFTAYHTHVQHVQNFTA